MPNKTDTFKPDGYQIATLAAILTIRDAVLMTVPDYPGSMPSKKESLEEALELLESADSLAVEANKAYQEAEEEK